MALIKFEENHTVSDAYAVAVYAMERKYGGPEEGDWWYDAGELVAIATADSDEAATALALELEGGEFKNTGRPLHSVNFGHSGTDKAYRMSIHAPGEKIVDSFPEETPHYE